ncbi:alpha/beta fold hydrolase [Streptomyces gardneri]|uniref:alpha/beta fold hydrolase n=1 Tax=Streptomyces gardneri TaxID=66892 RepID=UPI0036B2B210
MQIAHGMGEHGGRYAQLAQALNAGGHVVYAPDHRGHGRSMHAGKGRLGADGWNLLVEDTARLSRLLRDTHPGLPLALIGHSLGSFAVQQCVLENPWLVDAVALTGTTALDRLAAGLAHDARTLMLSLNEPFQPARTIADWLSQDEDAVDAYLADPLCGFTLDTDGFRQLAQAGPRLAAPIGLPGSLPVYVCVGEDDPLNAGLTGSDLVVARYREAGLTDITYRTYSGARHEPLHETNRAEVVADLTTWLEDVTA